MKQIWTPSSAALLIGLSLGASGCAGLNTIFGVNPKPLRQPISNPFSQYRPELTSENHQNMILRTKKGDRSVELEIPGDRRNLSEFVLPVSPAFKNSGRGLTSLSGSMMDSPEMVDESYKNRAPTFSDRDIVNRFPQGAAEDESRIRDIERTLDLVPSEEGASTHSSSYLGAVDHIKQLYRMTRFEAALIETDELIRQYQTDSKLYEMRGTLLDKLGRKDLALQAWSQALRFDPRNLNLKKFLDRKRSLYTGGSL
ncbi:MAG: hypothetical protein ACO3A2_08775 [Bdellovibrionia bacterium]